MLELEDCPRTGGAGWATLEEENARSIAYLEAKEFHAPRAKMLIVSALAGHIPSCPGMLRGKFEPKMEAGDLWEAITEDADPAMLAKLLASPLDRDAKSETWVWAAGLIESYANEVADVLAKEEVGI